MTFRVKLLCCAGSFEGRVYVGILVHLLERGAMARIIIVGSGVVGAATGKGFLRHQHAVEFVDINASRIDELRAEGLAVSDEINPAGPSAFIFLTLPTPNVGNRYDLSAIESGSRSVGQAISHASARHTVVVRSTVPPGTTTDLVGKTLVEASGSDVGADFTLASNPEFLRAACALDDFLNPWMTVVGSSNKRTVEKLVELYRPFGGELHAFDDPRTTEMIKCVHNIYNATKISFWNEMGHVADGLGIDIRDVSNIVSRSAEGSINLEYGIKAGSPYGGACLPKDTRGFLGFAAANGFDLDLLTATIDVNEKTADAVNATIDLLGDDSLAHSEPQAADVRSA